VFVLDVCKTARKGWAPRLNHEHDRWIWADRAWIRKHRRQMHPVVLAVI